MTTKTRLTTRQHLILDSLPTYTAAPIPGWVIMDRLRWSGIDVARLHHELARLEAAGLVVGERLETEVPCSYCGDMGVSVRHVYRLSKAGYLALAVTR